MQYGHTLLRFVEKTTRYRVRAVTMLPDPLAARVGAGREGRDAEPARPHDKAPPAEELAALMRDCGDNISEVARRLGKDRRQVYRWLAKLAPGNADDL